MRYALIALALLASGCACGSAYQRTAATGSASTALMIGASLSPVPGLTLPAQLAGEALGRAATCLAARSTLDPGP